MPRRGESSKELTETSHYLFEPYEAYVYVAVHVVRFPCSSASLTMHYDLLCYSCRADTVDTTARHHSFLCRLLA